MLDNVIEVFKKEPALLLVAIHLLIFIIVLWVLARVNFLWYFVLNIGPLQDGNQKYPKGSLDYIPTCELLWSEIIWWKSTAESRHVDSDTALITYERLTPSEARQRAEVWPNYFVFFGPYLPTFCQLPRDICNSWFPDDPATFSRKTPFPWISSRHVSSQLQLRIFFFLPLFSESIFSKTFRCKYPGMDGTLVFLFVLNSPLSRGSLSLWALLKRRVPFEKLLKSDPKLFMSLEQGTNFCWICRRVSLSPDKSGLQMHQAQDLFWNSTWMTPQFWLSWWSRSLRPFFCFSLFNVWTQSIIRLRWLVKMAASKITSWLTNLVASLWAFWFENASFKKFLKLYRIAAITCYQVSALHNANFMTLTTTRPVGEDLELKLRGIVGRPDTERVFVILPVGYPNNEKAVPTRVQEQRKSREHVIQHLTRWQQKNIFGNKL